MTLIRRGESFTMAKLPIGIQSFEKIRQDGYLYIDKTTYIARLLEGSNVYFLSRPRRFGKSLFVSTLEAYFRGQKELFDGLAIADYESEKSADQQWIEYPVLKFSLSGGDYQNEMGLANSLKFVLDRFENIYGISHRDEFDLPTQFRHCIEEAFRISRRQIVVLVDEYDKPLLENLEVNPDQEEKNRVLFKGFFSVLKDEDQYLKFVFFTGVTKFSKVSIFSDLNQLEDLSLTIEYSGICGITEKEMQYHMTENIRFMADENRLSPGDCLLELREMYDGYHFSAGSEGVYNPFSLFCALKQRRFESFWFGTGTPTFLVRKLQQSGVPVQNLSNGVQATEDQMNDYRADAADVVPLFYQSGYLTIKGYDPKFREYTLSFPNSEVKYGYLNSLIPMVNPKYMAKTGSFSASRMIRYLHDDDLEPLMVMLQALLASIPYHEGKAPADEQQWRNVVYAVFTVLGQYVRTEVHSAGGRSDCIVENDSYVYLFEFKQDRNVEEALQQIEDKGYALPYAASGKKIVKIGADFSTEKKTLDGWKIV